SRNQVVTFLNFLLSSVVFIILVAAGVLYFGQREFTRPGPTTTTETVLIKPNTGTREIANLLQREGVIRDARVFLVGLRINNADSSLKAGEYEIKPGSSMKDVMDLLKSGKSVMYSLTIPEGLTVKQVFDRIARMEELSGDLPTELPPEGSL